MVTFGATRYSISVTTMNPTRQAVAAMSAAKKEKLEKAKASVRAKVEHPFHVLKNLFRHRKTRYRGLAKNTAQLHTLFAFANLVLAGRTFGSAHARTPS